MTRPCGYWTTARLLYYACACRVFTWLLLPASSLLHHGPPPAPRYRQWYRLHQDGVSPRAVARPAHPNSSLPGSPETLNPHSSSRPSSRPTAAHPPRAVNRQSRATPALDPPVLLPSPASPDTSRPSAGSMISTSSSATRLLRMQRRMGCIIRSSMGWSRIGITWSGSGPRVSSSTCGPSRRTIMCCW